MDEKFPIYRILGQLDRMLEQGELEKAGSHLRYWLNEARAQNNEHGEMVILSELTGYCREAQLPDEGIEYVSRLGELVYLHDMEDTVDGATMLLNCGTVYCAFSDPVYALDFYNSALTVYERELAPDDEQLAGLYNNMAIAAGAAGDPEKAAQFIGKAIAILSGKPGRECEIAISYLNLADLSSGDDKSNYLDRAFSLLSSEWARKSPIFKRTCGKAAPAYLAAGLKEEYEILSGSAGEYKK